MSGIWSTAEIAGKQVDVYDPPPHPTLSTPEGEGRVRGARFGLLFLHPLGLETLHDRPAFTRVLAELGLTCLCPHARRCWWADRICAEFDTQITPERHLLDNALPYFRQRWDLAPRAIGLLGTSMGGQGALRLAFKHPKLFPAAAAISPAIDYHEMYGQGTPLDGMYDSKEQCRQDTVTLHVHPAEYPPHIFFCIDPDDSVWFRGCDRLHEKLNALGIPHEADLATKAGGHSWDYVNHMAERAIRFVYDGLVEESRRLL